MATAVFLTRGKIKTINAIETNFNTLGKEISNYIGDAITLVWSKTPSPSFTKATTTNQIANSNALIFQFAKNSNLTPMIINKALDTDVDDALVKITLDGTSRSTDFVKLIHYIEFEVA